MVFLKWILLGAVGLYLAALLLVYFAQRNFIYFLPTDAAHAGFYSQQGAQKISVDLTGVGTIDAVYKPPLTKSSPVILFFHGNDSAAYQYGPEFDLFTSWGAGYLGAEYPGYAGNAGTPNQDDILALSLIYYDKLIADGVEPAQIILYGDSLGAACAVHVASQREAAAIVLTAPFLSMSAMAKNQMPWFPTSVLLKDTYRSDLKMPQVKAPLLLINGDADQVIPHSQGQALFNLHLGEKDYVLIKGGHHNLWNTEMPQHFAKAVKRYAPTQEQ